MYLTLGRDCMLSMEGAHPVKGRIRDAVAAEVSKEGKVVSKGELKCRLIIKAPDKRTDLNFAIAKDEKSAKRNRKWVPLNIVGRKGIEKTVFANVNSLSKRLDLKKSDIRQAVKDHNLETLVSEQLEAKLAEMEEEELVASLLEPSQRKLKSSLQKIRGALADAWWNMTTRGWNVFRFRFSLGTSDEKLQKQGELRALTACRKAYKQVPAYRKHVNKNSPDGQLPTRFSDVPLTGKKEYIQKVKNMDDLYLDGQIPTEGQMDSSTGTTGEPALWVRSAEELAMTQKLMSFAKKAKFGNEDVVLLNTFALGLWATGITLAGAGPNQGLIANIGIVPDYAEKCVAIIKKLTKKNPDRAVVLSGYPPNIRKIADAVQNDPELKKRVDNGKLNLHAIVGGEGMTEELRQDILDRGFKTVYSSYGASDLDINIGYETDTEIEIRRACIENPALAQELYGGGPPPMVFHYDPMHYYIEMTKDNELVYTCCRKERASPRIRYNLHDTGKVMMAKDVCAIMKKYGVEIHPRTNLPFLFIHGREGTVSYGGSKIHYEHLEQAIREWDTKGQINMDRFALHKKEADDHLEFWIEASSDEAYEKMSRKLDKLQPLVNLIAEKNTDFRKILDGQACPYPQIRLFRPGQSIMSIHAERNPHRKLQRVVADTPEVNEQLEAAPDAFILSEWDY
jgi:phenylacetate-CoA ligase